MIKLNSTLVILVAMISCALAQDPAQSRPEPQNLLAMPNLPQGLIPGYYHLYVLMNNPRVIEELQLTEKQASDWKEIRKKQEEVRTESRRKIDAKISEALKNVRENKDNVEVYLKFDAQLTELENQRKIQTKEMGDSDDRQVLKLLDRKQQIRLKEIRVQAEGPKVFEREEIQVAMDLTAEQIQEIKRINFEFIKQLRTSAVLTLDNDLPNDGDAEKSNKEAKAKAVKNTHSNMATVRFGAMKSIEKVLTNTQRKVYKKMVGESFDFLGMKEKDAIETKEKDAIEKPKSDK